MSTARIARIARSRRRLRLDTGAPGMERLVPHTSSELPLWIALSITAGCCEEFVFRGYLIWFFQPRLGLWGAAALSILVFGAAHAYQGMKGAVAAGAVATALTFVVLAAGSLWAAVVMHAIIDVGEGLVAWLVIRRGEGLPMPLDAEQETVEDARGRQRDGHASGDADEACPRAAGIASDDAAYI